MFDILWEVLKQGPPNNVRRVRTFWRISMFAPLACSLFFQNAMSDVCTVRVNRANSGCSVFMSDKQKGQSA